jgi:replicative DNA helicase
VLPPPTPGGLTIIGASTNVGKSFFALGMLRAMAEEGPVAFVSVEDPEEEVGRRAYEGLSHPNLLVSFPPNGTLSEVLAAVAEAKAAGCRYAIADYAQLIAYDGPVQVFGEAHALKRTVIEYKSELKRLAMPGALTSQVRRPQAGEGPMTLPTLQMLSESSQIEKSAEVVILLGGTPRSARVRAVVAKAKNAPVGASARFRRGPGGRLIQESVDEVEEADETD